MPEVSGGGLHGVSSGAIRCVVVTTGSYAKAEKTPFPATLVGIGCGGVEVLVVSMRTGERYSLYTSDIAIDLKPDDSAWLWGYTEEEYEQAKKEAQA